jgi:NAD(P)-dependent dehydrogenase (short-subunit alcohol dehydrogenase family)
MVERGGGAIVNVGSTVIVRVNTFAPGFVETEALLARPEWKAGRRETVMSGTPAGRIPGPEEMTGAALFLASDDAHHITGSYMIDDGGYRMLGA